MKKIILAIVFIFFMIITTFVITIVGFKQHILVLQLLGFGIPFWCYFLILCTKFLNRITIEKEFVTIKNLIWGEKKIFFEDIQYWTENSPNFRGIFHRSILLKVKQDKRKSTILEDIDYSNYNMLRSRLISDWKIKKRTESIK